MLVLSFNLLTQLAKADQFNLESLSLAGLLALVPLALPKPKLTEKV